MTKRANLIGLLAILPALAACDLGTCEPFHGKGTVKSVHADDPNRLFVVCRDGDSYSEVVLSAAIIKQVKEGDPCPAWTMPYPTTTTTSDWRR